MPNALAMSMKCSRPLRPGLALLSALLAGMAMAADRRRNWVHMIIFAATLAGAVYVIVDLEYPRFGLIRVDAFDRVLVDLRRSMQ